MTKQISTSIHYLDDWFEVLDCRNVVLFDPTKLNIKCNATSTSNYKGYECEYSIKDGELYLTRFVMSGAKVSRDLASLNFLLTSMKNIVDYQPLVEEMDYGDLRSFELMIRSDHFYDEDIALKIQNAFLIAKDRRVQPQLSASRDDLPWNYKVVHLVKIKDNRLISVEDYSNVFYQFLRLFTSDGVLEKKYRNHASEFLTENLGVKFDSHFKIVD